MNSPKRRIINTTTIGFALFAMFFGAGNLILPPYIGLTSGSQWFAALLGFFVTAILAPFLGLLMVIRTGTSLVDLGKRVHPQVISVIAFLIILCIGPLVAIPRTGATTFEVGISPLFPSLSNIIFAFIFFGIVLVLSISKTKIVDIIGKFLTPFLLVSLAVLVLMGIVNQPTPISTSPLDFSKAFVLGFTEGYQTLDVLAAVTFAGIIISAVMSYGYVSVKERSQITIAAGVISTLALVFIYGGLIYLGATTTYETSQNVSRTDLLLHISKSILGSNGTYVISVAIAFACLTTAIALTSAMGDFFERVSRGKIPYRWGVIGCTIISLLLSVNSVDQIISYAVNILLFIYPITLALIVYILIFGKLVKAKFPYLGVLIVTGLISLISVLENLQLNFGGLFRFKNSIPLSEHSLEWLLPSFITFVVLALVNQFAIKHR